GAVRAWDVETGELHRSYAAHDEPVLGLSLSPGGTTVALAGGDGTVRVWDLITGERPSSTKLPGWSSGGCSGAPLVLPAGCSPASSCGFSESPNRTNVKAVTRVSIELNTACLEMANN